MKPRPQISIRRITLLTLPFLLLLLTAYAAAQPDPRLTRDDVGLLDLPIEYLLSVFLAFIGVQVFAVWRLRKRLLT